MNNWKTMGNPLSPFIANLFMSKFETCLKKDAVYFPRIWLRYVDDIFAVFDTKESTIPDFLATLNSKFGTIQLTVEEEVNNQLPFLDNLVIRNNKKLEIDIYRKETNTKRYIMTDSNHCGQHKMIAICFLINRLVTFPLNKNRYNKELKFIKNVVIYNSYSSIDVDRILKKGQHKHYVRNSTTLIPVETRDKKFVKLVPQNIERYQ